MGGSANMVLVGFAIGSILGLVSVVCFLLGVPLLRALEKRAIA